VQRRLPAVLVWEVRVSTSSQQGTGNLQECFSVRNESVRNESVRNESVRTEPVRNKLGMRAEWCGGRRLGSRKGEGFGG
jgi:hypothetical protein